MSIYKNTLQKVILKRNEVRKELSQALFLSERTTQRLLAGERPPTVDETLRLKVYLNNKINELTQVAANL
ncbi:MAG: hypothetical protein NTZ59_02320 [Bacteroidetes bacterium]|nr:hypothetical protein [Bacteroidota bacterium]